MHRNHMDLVFSTMPASIAKTQKCNLVMAGTGDVLQTSTYEKTSETKFMKFLP
jgi:hypothetical protein